MGTYSVQSQSDIKQITATLVKGDVKISTDVTVFYSIGENPSVDRSCAIIRAGQTVTINLPRCGLKIAFLAADQSGYVSVTRINKVKASCSTV